MKRTLNSHASDAASKRQRHALPPVLRLARVRRGKVKKPLELSVVEYDRCVPVKMAQAACHEPLASERTPLLKRTQAAQYCSYRDIVARQALFDRVRHAQLELGLQAGVPARKCYQSDAKWATVNAMCGTCRPRHARAPPAHEVLRTGPNIQLVAVHPVSFYQDAGGVDLGLAGYDFEEILAMTHTFNVGFLAAQEKTLGYSHPKWSSSACAGNRVRRLDITQPLRRDCISKRLCEKGRVGYMHVLAASTVDALQNAVRVGEHDETQGKFGTPRLQTRDAWNVLCILAHLLADTTVCYSKRWLMYLVPACAFLVGVEVIDDTAVMDDGTGTWFIADNFGTPDATAWTWGLAQGTSTRTVHEMIMSVAKYVLKKLGCVVFVLRNPVDRLLQDKHFVSVLFAVLGNASQDTCKLAGECIVALRKISCGSPVTQMEVAMVEGRILSHALKPDANSRTVDGFFSIATGPAESQIGIMKHRILRAVGLWCKCPTKVMQRLSVNV